ncbi:MAG: VanZ family protein [Candidatus Cloacimonetes bacterium]|nr:VanZ family protein [Candidatus Cloacimonadota bacterium]MDD4156716.1 VanZ family protein [Candidatus Cloacimonadota bacterium]
MKNHWNTIIFIFYSILVLTVSSIPKLSVPVPSPLISPDKLAHFGQYFVFAFLYYKFRISVIKNHNPNYPANNSYRKDIYLEIFFLSFLIAIFDELHQRLIPGREFCWFDVLSDILGFHFFIFVSISYFKFIKKSPTPSLQKD